MEIIQFDLTGRGEPDIAETVYVSLPGLLVPGCDLPWAENIFLPGKPCHDAYERMQTAYARLRLRLETPGEDQDAEEMVDFLLDYSRIIATEMFQYGRKYQSMADSGQQ